MSKTGSNVISCKAAVCWGPGQPLKLEEVQVEAPKSCEIRVKMLFASVCQSDFAFIAGFPLPTLFPRVIGHEGVGMVESIGSNVEDMKEGDLVIPTFMGECKECENCMSEKTNLCLKYPLKLDGLMSDGTSRMSCRGQKLLHTLSCSTWAEYIVVNVNYAVKIDQSLPLHHASFLSCAFSTGFGATWKTSQVEKGSSVAVFGLGAVGLGVVEGARWQGASKIIGVDINERKREKGKAFGMTHFLNPNPSDDKSVSQMIKDLTDGMGVDYCFECTGYSPLINQAMESTKQGKGETIVIGGGKASENAEINVLSLLSGRTVKGSTFGGLKVKSHLPTILDKCKNKELPLDELVTHEISLQDINEVSELMKHPDCVKILIKI